MKLRQRWLSRAVASDTPPASGEVGSAEESAADAPTTDAHSAGDGPDEPAPVIVQIDERTVRRTLVGAVAAVLALLVIVWAWAMLAHFLFNILLAWLVAISFDPVVSWLARHGLRRSVGTAIVAVAASLALVGCFALFGSVLASQIADLVDALPRLLDDVVAWVNSTFNANLDPDALMENLQLSPDMLSGAAGGLAGGLLGVALSVVGLVFDFVTIVVFAIYFSADAPRLKRFVASWLKPAHQVTFIRVWDISVSKAGGFLLSKLVLAAVSAAFHVGFFYLIDVPFWLPMGIFAGLVSQFVPTIGTYIGVALPALFAVFVDPLDVVWIIVFATAYQQVENYVLTPRVSTKTMDINSGVALAAVFVGAALFGPIGAIIGIPLVAIAMAVIEAYGQRYDIHPYVERHAE